MPSDPNIKKRLRTLLLKKAAMIKKAEPPTWYNEGAKRIGSFLEDVLRESRPYVESAKNRIQAFLEDVAETARPYVEQTPKSRTNTQLPPWEIQRILAEEKLRRGIRIPQRQEIVGPELVIPESNEQEPPRTPETNLFPILSQPQPTHELPPWESRPTAPSSPLAGETGTPLLPQLEPESAPPSTAEAIARNFLIDAIRSGVQVVPMGTQEEQAEWQLPPPPPAPPAPDWGPVTYEVPSAPSSAASTPDFPVSPAPPLPFASDLVETPAPLTPTVTPTQTAPTPSPPVYYYYPTYRRPLLRRPIIRRPIIRRPIFRRPIFRRFR